MTLYEIVLRRPERRDEVRFTDQQPQTGSLLEIDGRAWKVGAADASSHELAQARFICVIDDEPKARPHLQSA